MAAESRESVSPVRQAYLRQIKRRRLAVLGLRLGLLVLFFALWECLGRLKLIDTFITSQPWRICRTLASLYREGDLFRHIGVTCLETAVGFTLGTVIGSVAAVFLWWSDFLAKICEPYLVVLNSLPKIALGPIFIVWIGAGPAAIVLIALAISLVVTILEVLNGFLAADQDKIKLVRSFGAGRAQVFSKVVLPANVPTIINALKINVGLSWVGVIVGEFLVSRAGLGYLIVYGGQVFQLDLVMASVLILAAAAALMYQAVVCLEKLAERRWSQERRGT